MIPGSKDITHKNRLQQWKLTMLETRKLSDDMIETFKILHYKDDIDKDDFFKTK